MDVFLGQSFKPIEVKDHDESAFKVAEDAVTTKPNQKVQVKAKAFSKGKSPAVELSTPPEVDKAGKTFHVSKSAPRPYHIQTHVVNITNHNSNIPVTGFPMGLHVRPDLPKPSSDTLKQAFAVLSRQQANDLNSSKASTIHNHGAFEWGAFSKCTATCGSGVRKRYRKCSVEDCTAPGIESQVVPCTSTSVTCSGMLLMA